MRRIGLDLVPVGLLDLLALGFESAADGNREGGEMAAIVEGARRIRNKLQEDGFFFAEVTEICSVSNPPAELGPNGTQDTCQNLNPTTLTGHNIEIEYQVERGRGIAFTDDKQVRFKGSQLGYSLADIEKQLAMQLRQAQQLQEQQRREQELLKQRGEEQHYSKGISI